MSYCTCTVVVFLYACTNVLKNRKKKRKKKIYKTKKGKKENTEKRKKMKNGNTSPRTKGEGEKSGCRGRRSPQKNNSIHRGSKPSDVLLMLNVCLGRGSTSPLFSVFMNRVILDDAYFLFLFASIGSSIQNLEDTNSKLRQKCSELEKTKKEWFQQMQN